MLKPCFLLQRTPTALREKQEVDADQCPQIRVICRVAEGATLAGGYEPSCSIYVDIYFVARNCRDRSSRSFHALSVHHRCLVLGWAELNEDGTLTDEISFPRGEDSTFQVCRWYFFPPASALKAWYVWPSALL
jgi:hypothetical protein